MALTHLLDTTILSQPIKDRPLLSVLFPETKEDETLVHATKYCQPALFAVEYALSALWQAWGVRPGIAAI